MFIDFHVKYPLFVSNFDKTWTLVKVSKNTQIPNFTKIRLVEAGLFRADRQTERYDESKSRSSQFCKSS
jgi:hypothetical protein